MKPSEAINHLYHVRDDILPISSPAFDALTLAISALEKQEPKSPMKSIDVDNKNFYRMYCPTCGVNIGHGNSRVGYIVKTYASQKHCGNCGQAIEWPEDEA